MAAAVTMVPMAGPVMAEAAAPATAPSSVQAVQEAAPAGWCVAVWYPSSEHPGGADSILANLDVIDIVHPFWYTPDAHGVLLDRSGAQREAHLAAWRAAGLLVLPSIFSGHPAYLAEPLRSAHVAAIVDLVESNDYDGIDIDYEMFPFETREAFSIFVEELAAGLHARGRLLAVTVHAKSVDMSPFPSAAAQDWNRLAAAADVFNLMTYDDTNRNEPPGPVARIGWVGEVVTYALQVAEALGPGAADKVRVGLPFYGYAWTRGRPPARATTWEATDRMVQQFGLEAERDASSQEWVVELNVSGLPRQQVFVSDGATTAARLAALAEGPGGVAIWGLGGEDPAHWQALREHRPAPCHLRRQPDLG